jgi:imidazolonepropionase-like amidohydrolase
MKQIFTLCILFFCLGSIKAQINPPINGVADQRSILFAFRNANIHVGSNELIKNKIMLVRGAKITDFVEVVPPDAVEIDCNGMHVYPSFIDISSSYGMNEKTTKKSDPGARHWNMAVHPEFNSADIFRYDASPAETLRKLGIGVVNCIQKDGIFRGTTCAVSLANLPETKSVLNPAAIQALSLSKGSSQEEYPSSLAGTIALIRQSFYDAKWYASAKSNKQFNISLQALNTHKALPVLFEAANGQDAIRAANLADEFGFRLWVDGCGEEYQHIDALNPQKVSFVIPINFPEAIDIVDIRSSKAIPLSTLMHWESAAAQPALLHKRGFTFAISSRGISDPKVFFSNLRRIVAAGLPSNVLLDALTSIPATLLGIESRCGKLQKGYDASFIICSDSLLHPNATILENWSLGQRLKFDNSNQMNFNGRYKGMVGKDTLQLVVKGKPFSSEALAKINGEKAKCVFKISGTQFSARLSLKNDSLILIQGNVQRENSSWQLNGEAIKFGAAPINLTLQYSGAEDADTLKPEQWPDLHVDSLQLLHPFGSYGRKTLPQQEQILIGNAKIWTCSETGNLEKASILIDKGKIQAIGTDSEVQKRVDVSRPVRKIDGSGKHVSPGIIDEHSHIALSRGVNEGTQNNTAEVRMRDALNAQDIDIYRQLAGGVTAAQLLHGSANPIGGQSALIKFRWGHAFPHMLINTAQGHIKFALGENVKQSNWGNDKTTRFPQTRMGVEQVFYDAFQRAKEYRTMHETFKKGAKNAEPPAIDLELEALSEILEGKRHITCHSYVQSEINMLMHVADSMDFKVNTFTHILEGYKLADKIKKHGANGSTFSDWWAYKWEVNDAIPYNGSIMNEMGITTSFNSDDAEMGRRLNQEAGKAVLYGKTPETEALMFVTSNPAKMLKIDGFTGILKPGNDADLVIWSDNPLSVYARAEMTIVDGASYFDLESDKQLQLQNEAIRNRITEKMLREKAGGKPVKAYKSGKKHYYTCDDLFNESENHEE